MSEEKDTPPEEAPEGQNLSDKSLLSAGQIGSSTEPIAETEQPINNAMEVHHHTHPTHGKKTWKEYFWEFLMLFLAVFCGFLAEYQLEHMIEHDRAKELSKSMYEDLKKDTAALKANIISVNKKMSSANNILDVLRSPRESWNDTVFYKTMGPIMTSYPFISTNSTYEQMKASGSLRYFKQSLINQINSYDVQLKKTKYRDEVEDKGIWLLGDLIFNIMNLEVMSQIRFNLPITNELFIKLTDRSTFDRFKNIVVTLKNFRMRSLQEYEAQLKIADQLLESLKKEYHLE